MQAWRGLHVFLKANNMGAAFVPIRVSKEREPVRHAMPSFILRVVLPGKLLSRTAVAVCCAVAAAAPPGLPPAASGRVDFVRDIQPILAERCQKCHGPKRQESHLRWDNREIAMQGGEHGAVIVPGKSAQSRVVQLVAGLEPDLIMPPKGEPLTEEQVGLLRGWIDQGAVWPESASVKAANPRGHWAFRAPTRPAVPAVKNKKWPRNPIDDFILARLEAEKLAPSPEAERRVFLRRLSLDLTGLPPTVGEMEEFAADRAPDAWEKQVERLLASPHYGERWARHWLDAARYADSNGYEKDLARSIWPYRDWVIEAYNQNLPFDQFAIDQLAGDLLPGRDGGGQSGDRISAQLDAQRGGRH